MDQINQLSAAFIGHANAELKTLKRELEALRDEELLLLGSLEDLRAKQRGIRSTARRLEEVLGVAEQLPLGTNFELGGKELQDVALSILESVSPSEPIHYAKWFSLVEEAGYKVRGKDPLATFLTQISRDERVERVGVRSGLYRATTEMSR